jgi:hypothetical protein
LCLFFEEPNMQNSRLALLLTAVPCSLFVAWSAGCGSSHGGSLTFNGSGTNGSGGAGSAGSAQGGAGSGAEPASGSTSSVNFTGSGAGGNTVCSGLDCQIHACSGGGSTTISGTIYDPAGKNPLYGVVAYVPNKTPDPITTGASCYSCSDLYTGDPIATSITDATGKFTITKAPDGANIPLVIQVGKWRRQFVLPSVTQCADTAVPDQTLTLPKNASEGDMPNIAMSTGSADTLECLLTRIGVDDAEVVPGTTATGHIHIFKGNNGAPDTNPKSPDPSMALWDSDADIMKYDIVLLSCEGQETENMNQQVLFDYTTAGGRVFASHYHYAWFNTGPFGAANLATWKTGSQDINDINATVVTTTWTNQPFQRGQSMHDWLQNVGALTNNELPIQAARHNADVSVTNTPSQPWILADNQSPSPGAAQDFTFDTPIGVPAAMQCGRVAYSDMHVGAASNDYSNSSITPTGCTQEDLSPQEKALEFIFFDLSSCVTPNNAQQQPPPPSQTQ